MNVELLGNMAANNKKLLQTAFFLMPFLWATGCVFPRLFRNIIGRRLNKLPGINGSLQRINFSYSDKSITVNNFVLHKLNKQKEGLFSISIHSIYIKLNWRALSKGEVIAETRISAPVFTFFKSEEAHTSVRQPIQIDWPVEIYKLEIIGGMIEFIDKEIKPEIKLRIEDIDIEGNNLTNIENRGERLGAKIKLTGKIDKGKLTADVKTGFMEEMPAFDVNMEIKEVDMKRLNTIFKAYGGFDVNRGNLGLFTEVASRDGKFKGYVKPVIKDLEVLSAKDLHKGFLKLLWEGVIAAGTTIIENKKHEEIATKIPFEGNLRSVKVNTWYAISETLLNAFVHALKPSIDFEIDINSVRRNSSG